MSLRAIDVHSHFFPRAWKDLGRRFGAEWPWIKHLGEAARRFFGLAS